MAERWYRAIRLSGRRKPSEIVKLVSKFIEKHNLGEYVPRLCIQRLPPGKRRDEFYLFLGILSVQKGEVPSEIASLLTLLESSLRGQHIVDVYFQEIKTMVSDEIDISNYTRTIQYRPPQPSAPENPFGAETVVNTSDHRSDESYNQLLYWLSVIGGGSWELFSAICQTLLPRGSSPPRQIFRRLRLLGHVEYENRAKHWVICPPCLVQVGDLPHPVYYLAGQRTPQMIEQLRQQVNWVSCLFHPGGQAPDCVRLTFETEQLAQTVASTTPNLRFAGDAAQKLANILPSLAEWQKELEAFPASYIVPGLYHFQQWLTDSFQPVTFRGETGFYQLTRNDDEHNPSQFNLFYDADQQCWYRGDWYDLRYLAQHYLEQVTPVHYNQQIHECAIELNSRWPHLYERSLVLASGQLPRVHNGWLYFVHISPELAQTLANKLGTSLEVNDA